MANYCRAVTKSLRGTLMFHEPCSEVGGNQEVQGTGSNVHVGCSGEAPGSRRSTNQVQKLAGIRRFREQVPLGSNVLSGCSGEVQGPGVPRTMFRNLYESGGSGNKFH
jgi:hypothetical protein